MEAGAHLGQFSKNVETRWCWIRTLHNFVVQQTFAVRNIDGDSLFGWQVLQTHTAWKQIISQFMNIKLNRLFCGATRDSPGPPRSMNEMLKSKQQMHWLSLHMQFFEPGSPLLWRLSFSPVRKSIEKEKWHEKCRNSSSLAHYNHTLRTRTLYGNCCATNIRTNMNSPKILADIHRTTTFVNKIVTSKTLMIDLVAQNPLIFTDSRIHTKTILGGIEMNDFETVSLLRRRRKFTLKRTEIK